MPWSCRLGSASIVVDWAGGALILLRAFVPVAVAPMLIALAVAIAPVHLPHGFSSIKLLSYAGDRVHLGQSGYEADLLNTASLRVPCVAGADLFAVDGAPKKRFARR